MAQSKQASERRKAFASTIAGESLDTAARVAVEMFDERNHLQMALRFLSQRHGGVKRVKERMLHHAGIVGYDDSESLVRSLSLANR